MKIGVSTWSFINYVRAKDIKLEELPAKAKEIGFDFIEFNAFELYNEQTTPEMAKRLKEECGRINLEIISYTTKADFLTGSEGNWEKEAERLKAHVDIANALGARYIRHDASWGWAAGYKGKKGFDDALATLAKGCRRVTEYASQYGIRTMVENHGYFCQDSERVEKLANSVDHENFGILIDIGNFLCVDEDPATALGRLVPYAFHIHAKDFHFKKGMMPDPGEGWFKSRGGNYLKGAIIGHGDVPVVQCLDILKAAHFGGAVAIEFEGMEESIKGTSIGLDNLRRYLG